MASGHPPRAGPARPARHTPVPTEWRIELPDNGAVRSDSEFGGCRSIEAGYSRGPVLGQGTYGEVYLATDLATGDQVAAKKIKMDNEKEGFPITAIREIKILSALANAQEKLEGDKSGNPTLLRNNIIGLREIVRSGSHKVNNFKGSIYMMFDYMDHDMTGLLERSQKEGKRFTAAQIKCYLKQLFSGLWLLDKRDILHRDLKNANLLVNNKGELKIADFGLARYYTPDRTEAEPRQMTNRVITLWYRPPELFLGADRYGTEVDTWSAGCIMFELLTGKPLFPGKDEVDQLEKIFSIMGQPTEQSMPGCTSYPNYQTACGGGVAQRFPINSKLRQHCSQRGVTDPEALNLLEQLLALNPAARIKAQLAVTHRYFFTDPMPAALCDMPKFPSSHEMTMKRARHEQRHGGGGGGQQRGQQQQQQQRSQQQGQQGAAHYQQQGGPAAQRQRTQGQYSGPQAPYIQQQQPGQHRGGGGGGAGQQPYRGGGGGPAPAAAAAMGGVAAMRMPVGGVAPAGIMPGTVLTQQQVQQMMAQGTGIVGMGMGMGMGMQAGAMQQPGANAGYGYAGQAPRPAAYGAPAGGGNHTGMQPHRAGGGALPMWQKERR